MCLLLSSQLRLSFVSVVFDFNDSLNDAAPLSPMLITVDVMKREEYLADGCLFVCMPSFVFTTQIKFSECCV